MKFSTTNVRLQTLVTLAPSMELPGNEFSPIGQIGNGMATFHYSMTTNVSSSGVAYHPSIGTSRESVILKEAFSSVPVMFDTELKQDYQELGQALSEMTELEEGDDWKVEQAVYQTACHVAAELMAYSFPPPHVFTHGPKSVVFNWSDQANNLYLTVSADRMSVLVSSPERIKRRIEFSGRDFLDPIKVFPAIQAAHQDRPITFIKNAESGPVSSISQIPRR